MEPSLFCLYALEAAGSRKWTKQKQNKTSEIADLPKLLPNAAREERSYPRQNITQNTGNRKRSAFERNKRYSYVCQLFVAAYCHKYNRLVLAGGV